MNETRGEGATFWLLVAWAVMMAALVACGIYGLLMR